MAFQLPINYTDPLDFTFDPTKATIDENGLRLILANDLQSWGENFDSDVGFTYDPTLLEFNNGDLEQLSQIPAQALFGANYNTSINGNWNTDSPTAPLAPISTTGTPTASGKLDLIGNSVTYDMTGISPDRGSFIFKITPNYSGSPSTEQFFLDYGDLTANGNRLTLSQLSNGNLVMSAWSNVGIRFMTNEFLSGWSPVAGTEYQMELTWLFSQSIQRLFIDGADFGNLTILNTDRDTWGPQINWQIGDASSDFEINDFINYIQPQNLTPYVPGTYSVSEKEYVEASAILPTIVYTGLGNVTAYTSVSMTGVARLTINNQYWNGLVWAASDGSYIQANTLIDCNTNIPTLTPSNTMIVSLVFPDTNDVGGSVSDLTFNYTGLAYPKDVPVYINAIIGITDLVAMAEDVVLIGGGSRRFLILQGQPLWWDGAAWVLSNMTFAESNTVEVITANAATLPITTNAAFRYATILDPTSLVTPILRTDWITFCFAVPQTYDPSKTLVFGHLRDISGFPKTATNMTITVTNANNYFTEGVMIVPSDSDATLYEAEFIYDFAWSLYESETAQVPYTFTGSYRNGGKSYSFPIGSAIIPKAIKVNIADLFTP